MEVAMTIQSNQAPAKSESQVGCLSVLVRLAWIFGGFLLLFGVMFIAQRKAPLLADISFWLFTFGLILLRFVDIKFLKGETMDNHPATLKHWRRYSLGLLITAGCLFILAKILAHLKLIS